MQQPQPSTDPFWLQKHCAKREVSFYISDFENNQFEEFHEFFENYLERDPEHTIGTSPQNRKDNHIAFLINTLKAYFEHDNVNNNSQEIVWIQEKLKRVKEISQPGFFNIKENVITLLNSHTFWVTLVGCLSFMLEFFPPDTGKLKTFKEIENVKQIMLKNKPEWDSGSPDFIEFQQKMIMEAELQDSRSGANYILISMLLTYLIIKGTLYFRPSLKDFLPNNQGNFTFWSAIHPKRVDPQIGILLEDFANSLNTTQTGIKPKID